MKSGDIWWTSLGEPKDPKPGFKQPIVIISSHDFNISKIKTIIVAVITSNLRLSAGPVNIE